MSANSKKKKTVSVQLSGDFLKEYEKVSGVKFKKAVGPSVQLSQEYTEELRKTGLLGAEDDIYRARFDDIGPVRSRKKEEEDDSRLDFFQKGAFEDGFDWSDIPKTILGTAGDAALGIFKGAGSLVEGVVDLGAYGVAGAADAMGKDDFANRLRKSTQESQMDQLTKIMTDSVGATDFLEKNSVLGRTSDAILQGLGQVGGVILTGGIAGAAGAGAAGATAATTGLVGISGMGSGMGEAYKGGATDEEAATYGLIAGASDAITELIFGGLGKAVKATGLSTGLSSADDMLAKKVSGLFTNQIAKNISEFGIKAGAEGLEEVLAGIAQAAGKKATYMSEEEFSEILKDENLLEQFVVGSVTSGIIQSGLVPGTSEGSLKEANKEGRDFITGQSQNEQAVIQKEIEKRIAQVEQGGKTLTKKERSDIEYQVEQAMERGDISIETIEETLGGDTYKSYREAVDKENEVLKEFAELYKGDELKQQVKDFLDKSESKTLREKLSQEVAETVKGDRLIESYNERARRKQAFQADLSKYDEKQKAVIQKAVESKVLNNTRKTHEFVDFVAKMSADIGASFDFVNNEKLKGSKYAVEGKTVNGFVDEDGRIVLNTDSSESRKFVVGHEITHVLEGTDLYQHLQDTIFEYAKSKKSRDSKFANEYMERLYYTRQLYKNIDGYQGVQGFQKIKREVVADLVGEYLFTDANYVNNLSTKNRNIFQKMYDEVKRLLKLATAGSKEAKELEKVKKAFDEAYRASGKGKNDTKAAKSDVKHSISETTDGRFSAVVDNDILKNIDTNSWDDSKKSEAKKAAADALRQFKDGIVVDGITRKVNKVSRREYTRSNYTESLYSHAPEVFADKMRAADVADDIVVAATNWHRDGGLKHPRSDNFVDFDHGNTLIVSGDRKYSAEVVVGITDTGEAVFYDVVDMTPTAFDIKKEESPTTATTQNAIGDIQGDSSGDNVSQNGKNVKYSLSHDSKGRELSPAVKNRFGNSKAVDDDGNLKALFHGTASGEFTIFDKAKGSIEGDFGSGFYFTDNEADVSEHYEGGGPDFENKVARRAEQIEAEEDIDYDEAEERAREELYKGSHKFEVYLNVENPAVVGETILLNGEDYLDQYNEEDFDDYDEYIAEVEQLVADDIENIVWEVEKNIDLYSTDGLAEVLYEAYSEGGIGIEELKDRINQLYLEDNEGNFAGNEVTRQIIESLGYDGIIDPTVSGKWNMDIEEGTTHYIVFKPNQIKAVTNESPTDNPDIHRSVSDDRKQRRPASDPLSDLRYEGDPTQAAEQGVAPVAENSTVEQQTQLTEENSTAEESSTVSNMEMVEDILPDNLKPVQEELTTLLQEKDEIENRLYALTEAGDFGEEFNALSAEWTEKNNRINELEEEIEYAEADRLRSLNDVGAPPEAEEADVSPDAIPLSKKAAADISREVRSLLGLSNKDMADVRSMIEEYSASETPDRAELIEQIEDRFGQYTEEYVDEDLREAKQFLRTYPINVSDSIKSEIADYRQLMRSNFGKIRFSRDGVDVDVAYRELHENYPGLFPESVYVPTDQLLHIIDIANTDIASRQQVDIDAESIEQVADAIIKGISSFRQTHRAKAAEQTSRADFNGLMADADQHVPPMSEDIAPVLAANQPMASEDIAPAVTHVAAASADDIAPMFDVAGKKGVPDGQQAFIEDAGIDKKMTRKERHEAMVDNIKTVFREKGFDFDKVLKKAKNLSTFSTVDNTPQRVMEKALGYKEGQVLADLTVNKVAQNETESIKWLNSFTNKKRGLLAQISKEYGIRPGSKKSAAAQMYAEGFYVDEDQNIVKYGDRELAIDFPDPKVRTNIKRLARDPRIRKIYDDTLASINESRVRNGYPEIPKLDNYFLHFRAMDDTFSKIGLPFNPNDIRAKDLPTDLNGVTADLKPGQPYFASAKHRKGKRTSFDMLGGLEKYLTSAKNQIFHIDDIQTLRALRDYIANTYGQAHGLEDLDTLSTQEAEERIEEVYESHLSTFAKFLHEEANILAGKTSLIDRGIEGIIGRRGITFLDTLNRQVGANMVGFNISSSLTNFLSVTQAMAKTNKFDFVKGFTQMASNKIASIFGKGDNFAEASPVMIRRKGAESFYRTPYQKVGDAGYLFMGMVDDISTELIARTKYNELTRKGMDSQQAHIETDKWVSRLMGDRSLGQQPQLYNSKMLGVLTKFQLEVRNQLDSQFYDTIQEAKVSSEHIQNGLLRNAKKAAKITSTFAQLAVLQHLFGMAFESVAGYNPAFDIIEVLSKAFGWDDEEEDEDTVLDNLEQGFLELLGDMPYTSILTGGRIPISSALPITELIKGEDQYGNEKSRWDTLGEVAPYYFLPGGYGQIKKTAAGLEMFDEDHPIAGSYTDSGRLRFTVEDTPLNRAQAAVFGQYASGLARDFFDEERKSLTEEQTQELAETGMAIEDYWKYRDELSKIENWYDKADYIASLDLPLETRNILINNVSDRKERIDLTGYENYPNYEEFDWAKQNPEKYALLQEYGISAREYKAMDDDSKDAYSWAVNNPEAYTLSRAVADDVVEYRRIVKGMWDLKADKDANGKTISGSRKAKVADYISGLDIGDAEKYILFKSEYNSDDSHNMEIINYLNDRDDLSSDDVVTILRYLGFTVDSQGYISW